jgi:FtsZ-binding cell division protein ZapB
MRLEIYERIRTKVKAERILVLQSQIDDLKKRLPRHSTPPAMLQQLEDLEEELEKLLARPG